MQLPNWGGSPSSSPTFPGHSQAEIFFFPEFGAALGYVPLARALTRSAGELPACRLLRRRHLKPAKGVKAAPFTCPIVQKLTSALPILAVQQIACAASQVRWLERLRVTQKVHEATVNQKSVRV
jgi:hypothetical protein